MGHDEGFWDDELEAEAPERAAARGWWAVLGSSYGLSAAVHVAILLILATIIITAPPEEQSAELLIHRPAETPPPYDEEAQKALETREEVPIPVEATEVPVVVTDMTIPEVTRPLGEPDLRSDTPIDRGLVTDMGLGGGGYAGAFGDRFGDRGRLKNGYGPKTESAVRGALRWLAAHQDPDGRWGCVDWARNCGRKKGLPPCSGPARHGRGEEPGAGNSPHDVGVSALSLLAFLGDGHTHRFGLYKATVRRGLDWLRRTQRPDGSIGFQGRGPTIYDHALATMALCEAFAITRDPRLREPAQRAVDFALDAQNPGLGWRYGVKPGDNDTSITGWFVLALKTARTAGLAVPDASFEGALAWLERATSSRGATGYIAPDGNSAALDENGDRFDAVPCMTAVGVVCRLFTGQQPTERVVQQGSAILDRARPEWEARRLNFYYWYYGTYAQYQVGGQAWKRWNEAMQAALLPHQRSLGCVDGSWDPVDEWGLVGGRVYATAINALTFEIYYRYARQAGKERDAATDPLRGKR